MSGVWMVPLIQPMVDANNNLIGFLGLGLGLALFQIDLGNEGFSVDADVSIIDSAGRYMTRAGRSDAKNWLGQQVAELAIVDGRTQRENQSGHIFSLSER